MADLIVESLEPVMMTRSSYCRHSTDPVWPWSILIQCMSFLRHICMRYHITSSIIHTVSLYLDSIVSKTTDNLLLIILQAVDSLAVLTAALNPSQCVPATTPVGLHVLSEKKTNIKIKILSTALSRDYLACTLYSELNRKYTYLATCTNSLFRLFLAYSKDATKENFKRCTSCTKPVNVEIHSQ